MRLLYRIHSVKIECAFEMQTHLITESGSAVKSSGLMALNAVLKAIEAVGQIRPLPAQVQTEVLSQCDMQVSSWLLRALTTSTWNAVISGIGTIPAWNADAHLATECQCYQECYEPACWESS